MFTSDIVRIPLRLGFQGPAFADIPRYFRDPGAAMTGGPSQLAGVLLLGACSAAPVRSTPPPSTPSRPVVERVEERIAERSPDSAWDVRSPVPRTGLERAPACTKPADCAGYAAPCMGTPQCLDRVCYWENRWAQLCRVEGEITGVCDLGVCRSGTDHLPELCFAAIARTLYQGSDEADVYGKGCNNHPDCVAAAKRAFEFRDRYIGESLAQCFAGKRWEVASSVDWRLDAPYAHAFPSKNQAASSPTAPAKTEPE